MQGYIREFYAFWAPVFSAEKDAENYFNYNSMTIQNFKGLNQAALKFGKNELVLLLGLNESGKTSILKAIECFDFNNDPAETQLRPFFTGIRNKHDIECNTPTIITADISLSQRLHPRFFEKAVKSAKLGRYGANVAKRVIEDLNEARMVTISRVIPFANGEAKPSYYKFTQTPQVDNKELESVLAQEIVRRSPYILYFEDFQDAIPERIYTRKGSDGFNQSWYEIIDGLFFNTRPEYNIRKFLTYYSRNNPRRDDARSVLRQVNQTLQETFTKKWKTLSGVEAIDQTELIFNESNKYFEIKIAERDGTTYSVHERSKGAIWYLAFLMKTEFRKKKLREGSGKPIYLIDEPASNLHSTAQAKMISDFEKLVDDTTVIYTTHSRYLISTKNIKNTHIVSRRRGKVSCTKWGDYITGKNASVTYYQPLYDCLQIIPTSFDIPWRNAILTEGPSDAATLQAMQLILGLEKTHAIYPGSSGSNLAILISLNLAWGAKFKILLDSDKEGTKQKNKYMREFGLREDQFVLLPKNNRKIEEMFEEKELEQLYKVVFGKGPTQIVNKKQFCEIMLSLAVKEQHDLSRIKSTITTNTRQRFVELFDQLSTTG